MLHCGQHQYGMSRALDEVEEVGAAEEAAVRCSLRVRVRVRVGVVVRVVVRVRARVRIVPAPTTRR